MKKNTGKVREKSGNFVRGKKWEPWFWGWGSRGVHGLFLVKKVLFADNNYINTWSKLYIIFYLQ